MDTLDSTKDIEDVKKAILGKFGERFEIVSNGKAGGSGVFFAIKEKGAKDGFKRGIKVLRPSHINSSDIVNDFKDELEKSFHLTHPNLVQVFRTGELMFDEKPLPSFQMEYVEGTDLDSFLNPKVEEDLLDSLFLIFSQMIDVLNYLHNFALNSPIMHLDIKAENVFISSSDKETPRIKLLDFGGAKLGVPKDASNTKTSVQTTFPNMPERYNNCFKRVDDSRMNRTLFMIDRSQLIVEGPSIDLHQTAKMLFNHAKRALCQDNVPAAKRDQLLFLIEILNKMDLDRKDPYTYPDRAKYKPEEEFKNAQNVLLAWQNYTRLMKSVEDYFGSYTIRVPKCSSGGFGGIIREIVDLPEFQRLRLVLQNDFANLIYPGATHTRYEHSLGVFQNTISYLDSLLESGKNHLFRTLATEEEIKAVAVVALIHDLGQYPFSHGIDDIEPFHDHEIDTRSIVMGANFQKALSEIGVAKELFYRLLFHIQGAPTSEIEKHSKEQNLSALLEQPKRHWHVYQEIINGPIDVDKLDYFLRDCHHAGIPYGAMIDRDLLFRSLIAYSKEQKLFLGVTDKGVISAELFAVCRYSLYRTLYWHHTIRAFIAMLRAGIKDLTMEDRKKLFDKRFNLSNREFLIEAAKLGEQSKKLGGEVLNQITKRTPYFRMVVFQAPLETTRDREEHGESKICKKIKSAWESPDKGPRIRNAIKEVVGGTDEWGPLDLLLDVPKVNEEEAIPMGIHREGTTEPCKMGPLWHAAYAGLNGEARRIRIFANPRLAKYRRLALERRSEIVERILAELR